MHVPVAAVHEDDLLSAREDYIGFPVEVGSVDLIANPHGVQQRADSDFGTRGPAP
jgi:hypothetical protein